MRVGAAAVGSAPDIDPLQVQAVQVFADDLVPITFPQRVLFSRGYRSGNRVRSNYRRT